VVCRRGDVEAVLEDTFDQPVSSRSTVSRILEDTRERYRRGASAGSMSTTSFICSLMRSI
jgi:hypothetical protein